MNGRLETQFSQCEKGELILIIIGKLVV